MNDRKFEFHWMFVIEIALVMLLGWFFAFCWTRGPTMDAKPEASKPVVELCVVTPEQPTEVASCSLPTFQIDRSQTSNLVLQSACNNIDLSVFNIEEMLKNDFTEYNDTYYSVATFGCDDIVGNLCHNAGEVLAKYIVELSERYLSSPGFDCLIARVFVVHCTCLVTRALLHLSWW